MEIKKIKQKKTTAELLEFGIINIDKSSGPTSFNVSEFVKKTLGLRKTSHFGTLDPKVTGVLPVALNRACKLTGYFLGEDKEYIGIMRTHEEVLLKDVEKAITKKFLGKIKQTPPVKSRVKREEREREIKNFELLEQNGKDFLFSVECEGGTYIRKLIDDLGKELRIGAHMLELRRTRAGIFKENDEEYPCINLYDFEKAVNEYKLGKDKLLREIIIPGEIVIKLHKPIQVKKEEITRLFTGKPIFKKDLVENLALKKEEFVSVFNEETFIGLYEIINGKDILAKPLFVMQPVKTN